MEYGALESDNGFILQQCNTLSGEHWNIYKTYDEENVLLASIYHKGLASEFYKRLVKSDDPLSSLSPCELGKSGDVGAIKYLLKYLEKGTPDERRLSASAINKLYELFPSECSTAIPFLIKNVKHKYPQVRQYSLIALRNFNLSNVSEDEKQIIFDAYTRDEKDYNRLASLKVIRECF